MTHASSQASPVEESPTSTVPRSLSLLAGADFDDLVAAVAAKRPAADVGGRRGSTALPRTPCRVGKPQPREVKCGQAIFVSILVIGAAIASWLWLP